MVKLLGILDHLAIVMDFQLVAALMSNCTHKQDEVENVWTVRETEMDLVVRDACHTILFLQS